MIFFWEKQGKKTNRKILTVKCLKDQIIACKEECATSIVWRRKRDAIVLFLVECSRFCLVLHYLFDNGRFLI